jgi:superfamily II DNA or RNA helicase
MLTLKRYQQKVLDELSEFFINATALGGERGIRLSFLDMLGDAARQYKPIAGLEVTPFLCVKVPTGGGKTVIAASSLEIIQEHYRPDMNGKGIVLWLVPSDAIRTQTIDSLKDRNHAYREVLDQQFNNNVKVFSIEEALRIQKSDIAENICIIVASLGAFRRVDPTWLKVGQDNGELLPHFEDLIAADDLLDKGEDGEIIYSLNNVIKMHSPIVIVDEGHNAQTSLSFDMLRGLSPAVILEFTATPRGESNILVEISASELKAEKMVKIPIWLMNVPQWQEAIRDGVKERSNLEKLAISEKGSTGEYIRPIALLQAQQEKTSETKVYVQQVKDFLLQELKVPDEQIAIKTATQDEIKGYNLLSSKCPIRYIITVNALKEGWDCPFAYVLISVANIGSAVAVEQTIGRILRLPLVKHKKNAELNCSYVFASSESFSKASSIVIKGLEGNGYSRDDLRQYTGKVVVEKELFHQIIKDSNISIPVIGLKGHSEPLAFNRDLVGSGFVLNKKYKPFRVDLHSEQGTKAKIDIDEEKGIYRVVQGKLSLVFHKEDFSLEELSSWLKKNVHHRAVSASEMSEFIDLALTDLIKKESVEQLSINRFRLKDKFSEIVSEIIADYAKSTFDGVIAAGKLTTGAAGFTCDESLSMSRVAGEHFQKHLYEQAGVMNGEELELAFKIDDLPNVKWWFRNREKEDYYIQGWKSGKFYPDFILKLNSGIYIIVEYKGEDRLTNDDTAYKAELGAVWEKLSRPNHFYLVGKATIDEMLKQIATL